MCKQAYIDLHTIALCGRVLEYEDNEDNVMPFDLRKAVQTLVLHKLLISSRLKSLFSVVYGAAGQLGKLSWDYMEQIADKSASDLSKDDPDVCKYIIETLALLDAGPTDIDSDSAWTETVDTMAELFDGHGEALPMIGDTFVGHDLCLPEMKQIVEKFVPTVLSSIDLIFTQQKGFGDWTADIFSPTFHYSSRMQTFIASIPRDGDPHQEILIWLLHEFAA